MPGVSVFGKVVFSFGKEGKKMKTRLLVLLPLMALSTASVSLTLSTPAAAQSPMKDDLEQLAMDLHVGIQRSTLTGQQKAQLHQDFKDLRKAHQNHEKFATMRAARRIRSMLDSGAFQPQDQQRIKEDMKAIRELREASM
jgi:hypothetical protein